MASMNAHHTFIWIGSRTSLELGGVWTVQYTLLKLGYVYTFPGWTSAWNHSLEEARQQKGRINKSINPHNTVGWSSPCSVLHSTKQWKRNKKVPTQRSQLPLIKQNFANGDIESLCLKQAQNDCSPTRIWYILNKDCSTVMASWSWKLWVTLFIWAICTCCSTEK